MGDSSLSLYETLTYAVGVAGNLFSLSLITGQLFRRICQNKSTEQFSGLPYVYSLLNCLIVLWYGLPWVSQGVILVVTVNSVGALFHLSYSTTFIVFSENSKRFKMVGLLLAVFCIFALIIYVSLEFFRGPERQNFVGYLSIASLISMCASPLFIIKLVIRTKSVEFMPFYLSLATFLMSISFFTYGMLLHDFFIYLPNGVGAVLGLVQLLLYAYYSRRSSDISRLPLLVSN
ncbi:bidirectional sugar transporter SWEET2a-like [Dioscorea cayenensis subsp. rotundata]|uniref:Bidirectional sugar transporter SWEET n=1 Tax=Dioscorea cayennensis subsp. rotundata TaxID=55577 RepID=A0AB40BAE6_DIOCR|nr:bidirectional sugar transporter SWEET2a-like [Dioscorea cayenensis subsp. rotundata]